MSDVMLPRVLMDVARAQMCLHNPDEHCLFVFHFQHFAAFPDANMKATSEIKTISTDSNHQVGDVIYLGQTD